MKPKRAAASLLLAVALGALSACAPVYGEAFLNAFAAGERAHHAGRYVEAAGAYGDAADRALRVKDRDEARFLQARCLDKAGHWDEARAAYTRLGADSPSGPRTERAAYELADLEIAHGDPDKGFKMMAGAAVKYPRAALTREAFRRVAEHVAQVSGEAAALAWLRSQAPIFKGTEQDQTVAYEIALSLERLGRTEEAHDALLELARDHPYPKGGLTDDALSRAATLDEQLGRYAEAVKHLEDLLATHEVSHTMIGKYDMASYERPRFPEAGMRIAVLYRDQLHDHAAARRAFEAVFRDHPTARKRDLALWSEALLAQQDGDAATACDLAERIVRELPESRYVNCARAVCPGAPAGKRECAEYILRGVAAGKPEEGFEPNPRP